jgi:hypothetical protein
MCSPDVILTYTIQICSLSSERKDRGSNPTSEYDLKTTDKNIQTIAANSQETKLRSFSRKIYFVLYFTCHHNRYVCMYATKYISNYENM